jgi:hypothetical protein
MYANIQIVEAYFNAGADVYIPAHDGVSPLRLGIIISK